MRVILFLLKSIVAIFAVIGLMVVSLVALLFIAADRIEEWEPAREELPAAMVLELDLAAGVSELASDNILAAAGRARPIVLRDAVEALKAAESDERVEGLLIRAGRGDMGLAQMQELRAAIASFRQSGKFAVAFAESFGEGGNGTLHYYLASVADEVWLQPSGDVAITGFLLESPFVRDALDEIGVKPRLAQREEYKGAADIFTADEMPEPLRENRQRLVDSWLGQMARDVAGSRGLSREEVQLLVDNAPHLARDALQGGLIDQLGYWDEVRAHVEERSGDSERVGVMRYASTRDKPDLADAPAVALIHGVGAVSLAESQSEPFFGEVVMGSDTIVRAVDDALEDADVKAIVLRVNSPGGSYVASDAIWRAVGRATERGVPVIVSMSDVAASGGYFVAAPATRIVAQPGTVTGSIGVVSGKFVLDELWDDLGINFDGVQAGSRADIWSFNRDFTPAQWLTLQQQLNAIYEDFTGKVAEGRNLSRQQIEDVAKGRIWTGEDARANGLVDALGGYSEAVALAKEEAGIDAETQVRLTPFPKPRDPFRAVVEDFFGSGLGSSPAARALVRLMHTLAPLVETLERVQADPRENRLRVDGVDLAE